MARPLPRTRAKSDDHNRRRTLLWVGFLTASIAAAIFLFASQANAAGSFGGGGFSGSSSTTKEEKPKGPTSTKAYRKAVKLINKEQYQEAISELLVLNAQQPGDPDVLNYLGYAHRQLDKNEIAMEYYTQALAVKPKHKGANEYLGELYLKMGELEKAEAQLAKLDDICTFGCSEYRELKAKIEAYKQENSAS